MIDRMEALRSIVASRQYAKVDGVLVDVWTASAILACYDGGSDRTKEIISTAPLVKVARLALRMLLQ